MLDPCGSGTKSLYAAEIKVRMSVVLCEVFNFQFIMTYRCTGGRMNIECSAKKENATENGRVGTWKLFGLSAGLDP